QICRSGLCGRRLNRQEAGGTSAVGNLGKPAAVGTVFEIGSDFPGRPVDGREIQSPARDLAELAAQFRDQLLRCRGSGGCHEGGAGTFDRMAVVPVPRDSVIDRSCLYRTIRLANLSRTRSLSWIEARSGYGGGGHRLRR